jgi:hypothetical protein
VFSTRAAEVQDIAVGVLNFETAEVVGVVFDGTKEAEIARGEFGGDGIRIRCVDVCVPGEVAFFDVASVIGDGLDPDRLEHDHGATALNDAEKDVARFGSLKGDLKAELITIKSEGGGDIPGYKARGDAGDWCFGHR